MKKSTGKCVRCSNGGVVPKGKAKSPKVIAAIVTPIVVAPAPKAKPKYKKSKTIYVAGQIVKVKS